MPRVRLQRHGVSRRVSNVRQTVLVTGGSGGIGRAICVAFGKAGWRVGVHYRTHAQAAARTAAAVRKHGGTAMLLHADIRDGKQTQEMVAQLVDRWGRLDVMVCNAGQATSGLVLAQRTDEWREDIETNLSGTFHCLQAAAAPMQSQRHGSIVVIGSYAAMQGYPGQSAYAASKAGLIGLVKSAAREWGPSGIRVNLIFPGWQQTKLAGDGYPPAGHFTDHATGRPPARAQVAEAVAFLASMKETSGQVWNLDSRIV
jgi:3-oxoacyl-[acyl-carrier protein] reductase